MIVNTITRENTKQIKGIAIIFMLAHHFLTFPDWRIDSVQLLLSDNVATNLSYLTKICVPLFAFCTGYALGSTGVKSNAYFLKKGGEFLFLYWTVYLLLLIGAITVGGYRPQLIDILFEMICIKQNVMTFGWYVRFHLLSLALYSTLQRLLRKNFAQGVILGILTPYLVGKIISHSGLECEIVKTAANEIAEYYPVISVGFLIAFYRIYQNRFSLAIRFFKADKKICYFAIFVAVCTVRQYWRYILGFNMYIVYIPFAVFALVNLFPTQGPIKALLSLLGSISTNLWFLHCAFFNLTKTVLQPLAYWPRQPLLVLIWILLILSPIAWGIKWCQEKAMKKLKIC